jgi:radial spoke head protein 4A
MSLKKLATDSSATTVRFFGKIQGTKQDYYIAETQVDAEEEGELEEREGDFEPKGTGVNVYTYFVSKSSMSEWTRLPDISPAELKAARQICVCFSGDLNRYINTNPFFFGTEKIYLRAQIARITQSTVLIPKGVMRTVEDNDRDVEENAPEEGEVVLPSTHAMADPAMWVHKNLNLLKNCRTAHADPEEPEGAEDWDAEAEKKKIEEADPYDPRLK